MPSTVFVDVDVRFPSMGFQPVAIGINDADWGTIVHVHLVSNIGVLLAYRGSLDRTMAIAAENLDVVEKEGTVPVLVAITIPSYHFITS